LQDIKQKHEHEKLVAAQENDRLKIKLDDAREALMKIEEIFIDGGDTYLDFVRVGNIAREFLEKNILYENTNNKSSSKYVDT
jgi:hypothetical protein